MSLPSFSIRRRVTTLMLYCGVILFGIISAAMLSQELFPPVIYPKLSVITNYANAAPQEIETLITKPVEEAVGSTPGLRGLTSVSKEGLSVVVAEFGWEQNMDFAGLAVREKIDLVKARLPRDASEPTVVKFNPFELPVMVLSVASETRDPVKLKRFAKKWIKSELEKVTGVASATISGGADEEILVEVDQGRLKISSVGLNDVQKAISESNLNYPGGTIKESFYEYLVRTMGEYEKVDELNYIAIAKEEPEFARIAQNRQKEDEPSNELVVIKDVASVTRQNKERTSFSRFNHKENLTISIQKQAQANTIKVVDEVKNKLADIIEQAPEDIVIDVIDNQAIFIKDAINGVRDSAVQGGFLAFLILLIFLKNIRVASVICIIIPITVLATFTLMHFSGISLNVISLGGIALGVGMLVDAAIVVIENITRHQEMHESGDIRKHAIRGTEEVIAPLIASTLTTVMVFLPMVFITGIAGQIFKELAMVVVITQLFSLIVSITLLPMLIVQFNPKKASEQNEKGLLMLVLKICAMPIDIVEKFYQKILPVFIRFKIIGLFLVFLLFLGSVMMMATYDMIVMPRVDQGKFTVKLDLPVGTRVERTNSITLDFERYLRSLPEVDKISTIVGSEKATSSKDLVQSVGSHQARMIVTLKPDRTISTQELLSRIRLDIRKPSMRQKLKNSRVNFVVQESAFKAGGDESAPIVIDVRGNKFEVIYETVEELQKRIKEVPGVVDVINTIPESAPETRIIVDKSKASFYRFTVTDLATSSHIAIKGAVASRFKEEGEEIDIRVVLREEDRDSLDKLRFIYMHSPLGISVPLTDIVQFLEGKGPSEIKRENQERVIKITAKAEGRSVSDINADIEKILEEFEIPTGYIASLAGESLEVKESFNSMKLALILSVVMVYMVMAAQFESYFQPFIIMFTMPLSLIGVSLALGITHTEISVVVILGVILLGGIVVNNGIILIDFINNKMDEGDALENAVIEAGVVRFRPILMTAMTTILGLLPLALGIGEGSKLQSPMAIAVMGGLLIATFLTLAVIPAIYEGTTKIRNRFSKKTP